MIATDAQVEGLTTLLFAEELEERLESCLCITWGCDGKGDFQGCSHCVGWGCYDLLED